MLLPDPALGGRGNERCDFLSKHMRTQGTLYRAAKRLKASRCFIKSIIQPLLDAVRLRNVFDHAIALSEIVENAAKRPDSPPLQFVYAL